MKTIVLDFDGTIGDTCAVILETMRQTIDVLGLPERTPEQCKAMIGLPLRQTFTGLIPMSEEMGDMCERTYHELFDRNNVPGTVPLFPHVRETIAALHDRGQTVTIASSRSRPSLVGFIRSMDLAGYISYVVAGSDVEHAKPAPDMVFEILSHVGGTPADTLVVGDTCFDIGMGRNASAMTCGVTYGNGTRESLSDADYLIDDFADLLKL